MRPFVHLASCRKARRILLCTEGAPLQSFPRPQDMIARSQAPRGADRRFGPLFDQEKKLTVSSTFEQALLSRVYSPLYRKMVKKAYKICVQSKSATPQTSPGSASNCPSGASLQRTHFGSDCWICWPRDSPLLGSLDLLRFDSP